MKEFIYNTEMFLEQSIPGFHQYNLKGTVHIGFASKSLCEMTGYTKEELENKNEDIYLSLIYESDKSLYADFLTQAQSGEQTITAEYRLTKKDGTLLYVRDTFTTQKTENGDMIGYSVLADITAVKKSNEELKFLNNTIPCGFLRYTCDKQPKVTYINQQMKDFLRFPKQQEGEVDYLELYKENIFLMIPMEERRKFTLFLNQVYSSKIPVAGELTLLRCDGTRLHIFGWVTKVVNPDGTEEFQSVCMDITERHQSKRAGAVKQYIKALSEVYNIIFEYNIEANTVKCLYSGNSPLFQKLENIPMQMEDATNKWIDETVANEDKYKVKEFFKCFAAKELCSEDNKPPQISYKAKTSSGDILSYNGVFIQMNSTVSFFCCRASVTDDENLTLKAENETLKELVMQFSDGNAAFELKGNIVKPLYASENVIEFFGVTQEKWLDYVRNGVSIREFVASSDTTLEEIEALLKNGEAEFTYFDVNTETDKTIKAVCSSRTGDANQSRFIMLYTADEQKKTEDKPTGIVSVRTFGYFDIFVGDKPIAFKNKKSKELLALLVDRKGGYVTSDEAISFLWEDEPVNPVTLSRYRKVALRLKNALEEYGIADIIETVDGKRRIVMEKVNCDLYNYLSGKAEFSNLFKGSYLTNYSWAEITLGELTGNILY